MKACCKIVFRKALEEVLFTIKTNKIEDIYALVGALEYGVDELKKAESKDKS